MTSTTTNYSIDDGNSNRITSGLQGYDAARRAAQRMANNRGESVWLYEDGSESGPEEIAPAAGADPAALIADDLAEVVAAETLAAYVADETGNDSLSQYESLVRTRLGGAYDASAWDDAMEILRKRQEKRQEATDADA